MVQQVTDNFWQAEARSEETKKFIQDIKRLKPGIPANVTVLEIVEGEYLFSDGRDNIQGSRLLEPWLVLKDGAEVPCCSKYHIPPVCPYNYSSLGSWPMYFPSTE